MLPCEEGETMVECVHPYITLQYQQETDATKVLVEKCSVCNKVLVKAKAKIGVKTNDGTQA